MLQDQKRCIGFFFEDLLKSPELASYATVENFLRLANREDYDSMMRLETQKKPPPSPKDVAHIQGSVDRRVR